MPTPDAQEVFLGRQPILDRDQQLFAYELLFRSTPAEQGNFASFVDGNQATAAVIAHAFTEFSMASALGAYQAFIKVDQGLLSSELITALPPDTVVLEIVDAVAQDADVLERCDALISVGFSFAIREHHASFDPERPLLKLASVIKIDISEIDADTLAQWITQLKPLGKTLLAEKVEHREQMQHCLALGFDLFQGYFFARPCVIQGKRIQSSELSLLRLLTLLSQDADHGEIEKIFKQEPVLTMNLLRLTNSAGSGMTTRITSLHHAITLLGRRQLTRWLQLLLYSNTASPAHTVNPLLQLAATRGRLMELLADRTPDAEHGGRDLIDQAYMTGILSLMPTLIGVPMSEILQQMPLVQTVHAALETRAGTLGELLALVEQLEEVRDATEASRLDTLLTRFPAIDAHYANDCLSRALAWANNLARETT